MFVLEVGVGQNSCDKAARITWNCAIVCFLYFETTFIPFWYHSKAMEQQLVDQAMTGLDLSGSEDLPKANRLRIEGNVLYTSGRLELGSFYQFHVFLQIPQLIFIILKSNRD